ncbi:MAG TPA: hypothetical protein VIV64_09455 [Gammaproteobacteria bacterium]|jgi:hypothetical protein
MKASILLLTAGSLVTSLALGQSETRQVPAETLAAAYADPDWVPPRTSWGDPSLAGVWTTDDLRSVPVNRPAQFGEREFLTTEEFTERAARDESGSAVAEAGAFLQHEYGVRTFGYTSLVIDPPDGRIPELTDAGRALAATRSRGTFGPGPFNSFEDFSLYDRCISRGAVGSIMPAIYGNGVRIAQSPDSVAINYEMIHDTRIIRLDDRPPLDGEIRQWVGAARGYWDGATLVVESGNFNDRTNTAGGAPNSDAMKLTERFRRVDPEMIEYVVTVDDPVALTAPFTMRLMLTTQPGYMFLEYSCHEGNGAVPNSLSGERAYERQVAEAAANGLPPPRRAVNHNEIRNGDGVDISQPFDINAGE